MIGKIYSKQSLSITLPLSFCWTPDSSILTAPCMSSSIAIPSSTSNLHISRSLARTIRRGRPKLAPSASPQATFCPTAQSTTPTLTVIIIMRHTIKVSALASYPAATIFLGQEYQRLVLFLAEGAQQGKSLSLPF